MNKMNNAGRLLVLLLAALMALSLAACGAKGVGKMGSEPKSLEEAVAMYKELMARGEPRFSRRIPRFGKRSSWKPTRAWPWLRTAKTTASSCWTPSRLPRISLRTSEREAAPQATAKKIQRYRKRS